MESTIIPLPLARLIKSAVAPLLYRCVCICGKVGKTYVLHPFPEILYISGNSASGRQSVVCATRMNGTNDTLSARGRVSASDKKECAASAGVGI